MNPYKELANAIIILAVKDYRTALRRHRKHPYNREYAQECKSLEDFFRSGWFGILSDQDGEVLMEKIKMEVAA